MSRCRSAGGLALILGLVCAFDQRRALAAPPSSDARELRAKQLIGLHQKRAAHANTVPGDVSNRPLIAPPLNDFCASATPISGTGVFPFDNTLATTDGPPHAACLFFSQSQIFLDLWYCWTAPCTGMATVQTCAGTSLDTKMAIYNGCLCPVSDGTLIACNDDSCSLQSSATFAVISGNSYLIRLGQFNGANPGGTGTFSISCSAAPTPPVNDACTNAVPIGIPASIPGTTVDATLDSVPDCPVLVDTPGVWYSVVGDGTTLTASHCGGGTVYDSKISIYTGVCGALTCVVGNDDSCGTQAQVSWCSLPGTAYLILVYGYNGATGPFTLNLTSDGIPCGGSPTGSCCLPDGSCVDGIDATSCSGLSGSYQGDGSICGPIGACCLGGTCTLTTAACCGFAGGVYQGDGTSCLPDPCTPGACCLMGGGCVEVSEADCLLSSGSFQGPFTSCFPDPCGFDDCNTNGSPDAGEGLSDCNTNGTPDICEAMSDCNSNLVPDACEFLPDCNSNGTPDVCELLADCNSNFIADACEPLPDCNSNGLLDVCEPLSDCNTNGTPDHCEDASDCDNNGLPDACEPGAHSDCDTNGTFDICEGILDCNTNGTPDACDLDLFGTQDCNTDGILDACDEGTFDCDTNGTPDDCESFLDCNFNLIPDLCEPGGLDCNSNGTPDLCELFDDCNFNGVPDACEPAFGLDCNTNGFPDLCEPFDDCNFNGVPDVCEFMYDCDTNGIPDACEPQGEGDCNTNGAPDMCEGLADCNGNEIPDACELIDDPDCNTNGFLDECDIGFGTSSDTDFTDVPDECEGPMPCATMYGDMNGDGMCDADDIAQFVECYVNGPQSAATCGCGDLDGSGSLNVLDVIIFTLKLLLTTPPCSVDVAIDSNNNGSAWGDEANDDPIEEIAPGKILWVNDNDDNTNGTADFMDPEQPTPGFPRVPEYDLQFLKFNDDCNTNNRQWRVVFPNSITMWVYSNRSNMTAPPTPPLVSGQLRNFPVPFLRWVEAKAVSAAAGDIEIKLEVVPTGGGAVVAEDKVKATAAKMNLLNAMLAETTEARIARWENAFAGTAGGVSGTAAGANNVTVTITVNVPVGGGVSYQGTLMRTIATAAGQTAATVIGNVVADLNGRTFMINRVPAGGGGPANHTVTLSASATGGGFDVSSRVTSVAPAVDVTARTTFMVATTDGGLTTYTARQVTAGFAERDAERFYVEVELAGAGAGPLKATLETYAKGANVRTAEALDKIKDLELKRVGVTNKYRSDARILVANKNSVDDNFGQAPDVDGTDGMANDPTIYAELDGKVKATVKAGSETFSKTIDVCKRNPAEVVKKKIRAHILRKTVGGAAVVAELAVKNDLALMNTGWAQACLQFEFDGAITTRDPPAAEAFTDNGYDHDANPATPKIGAGNTRFDFTDTNGNNLHEMGEKSEPFVDGNANGGYDFVVNLNDGSLDEFNPRTTREERNLIDTYADGDNKTIEYFVVNALSGGSFGEAFLPGDANTGALLKQGNVMIVGAGTPGLRFITSAHECGHVLMNVGGHTDRNTTAGRVNMMVGGGTDAADAVGNSKRLTPAQVTAGRGF